MFTLPTFTLYFYPGMAAASVGISAAKKSTFSRLSQNETAKECYKLGFFDPANAAVSYTHLDVYKRQAHRSAAAGAYPALPGADPAQDLPTAFRPCG